MGDLGTLLFLAIAAVLVIILIFWMAIFMGLAAVGLLIEMLFLPVTLFRICRKLVLVIVRGAGAAIGTAHPPAPAPTHPRPGDRDYLEWANRRGRFSGDAPK